ncbi:MAG: membrane-bound lytic murein transglycosylase B [Cyclobacteriaceae bacterium]|jgi:membrane-bound lytic murein transglycosylase B
MQRLLYIALLFSSTLLFAQIDKDKEARFIDRHAAIYGTSPSELSQVLSSAQYQPDIIEKISKPAEFTMTWDRYRNIFIKEDRISAGVEFWKEYEAVLVKTSFETGVPTEIILGILGVETFFGQRKGSYKVLDALYTLSFGYPKREQFFQSELDEFLRLIKEENLNSDEVLGSYAGAIGYCQFMPSSYRAYAKSYDEGGTRDLVNSPEDAIASIANYLKVHRWKQGEPIVSAVEAQTSSKYPGKQSLKPSKSLADYESMGFKTSNSDGYERTTKGTLQKLDEEYWMGFQNFYVITRYNHSAYYALAVVQLAEAIKTARR